jgi:putative transposase
MISAYRFQLRARPAAERSLRRYAGMARQVWNRALAEQRARHARGEKYASYVDMAECLTAWRNEPTTAWLAEGPVHTQQQTLKRLDAAYQRFFAKTGGFPDFKRYGDEPGLRFPDAKQIELDQANGRVKLPKLGWMRMRQSRPVAGTLRNVSVTREGNKWFASIQVESGTTVEALGVPPTLGIDLGLTAFAATSEGELIAPLKAAANAKRKLKHAQRAVSRKKKGSANRKKAIVRVGNIHRRIAHQRADWLHKLTTDLADRHAVIAIEDLKVANMSASAKGTAEAPGKNARQKAALNRGILDAAWGEFARQLGYKTECRGGRTLRVDPAYTSQECRICYHVCAENRATQALLRCVACGHTEHADAHASHNILERGIALFEATLSAAGHAAWENERLGAKCPTAHGGVVRRAASAWTKRAAPVKREPTKAMVLA